MINSSLQYKHNDQSSFICTFNNNKNHIYFVEQYNIYFYITMMN